MPYIGQKERRELDYSERGPETPGELNYKITTLLQDYMKGKPKSYTLYNEAIGVLECCKQEFYRRPVAEYEEAKRFMNGDVF